MALVDDLLANPGRYLGLGHGDDEHGAWVGRIVVTPLPAGIGVTLDYEAWSEERRLKDDEYIEHSMLGRRPDGTSWLVVANTAGAKQFLHLLPEREPGFFVSEPGLQFTMGVRIGFPEPGVLRHAWGWGPAGQEPVEHEVALLHFQG